MSYALADVTDPEQSQAYVRTAVERYDGVDILLANAGIEGVVQAIPDYPIDMFDKVMAVNVRGVWLGLKYVMPEMEKRGGGSIVITSSRGRGQGNGKCLCLYHQQTRRGRPDAHRSA